MDPEHIPQSTDVFPVAGDGKAKMEPLNASLQQPGEIIQNDKPGPGHPTDYKPKYVSEIIKYFDRKPWDIIEKEWVNKKGEKTITHEIAGNDFPTLAGFAALIGVSRDTIHEWANGKKENGELKHPEFSDAVKRAKAIQENILVVNAMSGHYDSRFAQFFAINNLGYEQKTKQENSGTMQIEMTPAKALKMIGDNTTPPPTPKQ